MYKIKYKIEKLECKCCNRPFENIKIKEGLEFEINLEEFFDYFSIDISLENLDFLNYYINSQELKIESEDWIHEQINYYKLEAEEYLKIDENEYNNLYESIKLLLQNKINEL